MGAELRIGCSSWTSEAWWGRLYPEGLPDGERLRWYARLYDTVEVDASYYRTPSAAMVDGWRRKTPENFVFTLKFPRDLLDPKEPVDAEAVAQFLDHAKRLGPKLGPILLQFARWTRPGKANAFLLELLERLDPTLRYAVELRDPGWFRGDTLAWVLEQLRARAIALTWSYLTYVDVPPERTTDWIYLRFIGDHDTVPAETHGEIRVDRTDEMRRWANRLREHDTELRHAFIFFNNHFAGFAPTSVNLFRAEMGLPPIPFGPLTRSLDATL